MTADGLVMQVTRPSAVMTRLTHQGLLCCVMFRLSCVIFQELALLIEYCWFPAFVKMKQKYPACDFLVLFLKQLSFYVEDIVLCYCLNFNRNIVSCQGSNILRDHSVYAPSQWEMALQCNTISHWLGATQNDPCILGTRTLHIHGLQQSWAMPLTSMWYITWHLPTVIKYFPKPMK